VGAFYSPIKKILSYGQVRINYNVIDKVRVKVWVNYSNFHLWGLNH